MCGISGLVNCGNRHVQVHRGPDDFGLWEQRFPDGSYIGLGSRRLAILDLSPSGHVPMANQDRSLLITYNGEVYNFAELRRELQAKGSSRSQPSTVLGKRRSMIQVCPPGWRASWAARMSRLSWNRTSPGSCRN